MILLLILGTLIVCALLIGLGNVIGQRRSSLSKSQRQELTSLRIAIDKIDNLAYRDRDVYPEVTYQITQIIRDSRKELS